MAKWSVALFGHYKPRYYLRERVSGVLVTDYIEKPTEAYWDEEKYYVYDVQGWEKRAEPGDIIAARPLTEHHIWSDVERKQFLIVIIDDLELEQLEGLTEPFWDTTSYPVVTDERIQELINRDEVGELLPTVYHKKRRFNIPLNDLEAMGVEKEKMLDKKVLYSPKLDAIKKVDCYDKMKQQKATASTGFNMIEPIRIGKGYGRGLYK